MELIPFHVDDERPVPTQVASLTDDERKSFEELKAIWATEKQSNSKLCPELDFDDYMMLRFLRASPGDVKFNVKTASKVMKNFAKWTSKEQFHKMTIDTVSAQLATGCLIIPGTVNVNGHQFLYMKPAIYFPRKHSLSDLIASLVYLLDHVTLREKNATEGIAFMANMEDWKFSNFGVTYAKTFFDTMQGRYPLRVRMFLIVDPPSWFGSVWKVIRPMMSSEFAAKVFVIKKAEVSKYLASDEHLPLSMGGKVDLDAQLREFVEFKQGLLAANKR